MLRNPGPQLRLLLQSLVLIVAFLRRWGGKEGLLAAVDRMKTELMTLEIGRAHV